jgi:U6 snRNA-associated Sm-like protein LSm4
MLVELKNGETLNGHLVTCDTWMNLTLKEVVQTSPVCYSSFTASSTESLAGKVLGEIKANCVGQDGDKFYRLPEVYVKGNNVCSTLRFCFSL